MSKDLFGDQKLPEASVESKKPCLAAVTPIVLFFLILELVIDTYCLKVNLFRYCTLMDDLPVPLTSASQPACLPSEAETLQSPFKTTFITYPSKFAEKRMETLPLVLVLLKYAMEGRMVDEHKRGAFKDEG